MVNLIKLNLVCCLAVPTSGLSDAQGVTSTFDVMLYVNQDMPDKDRLVTHATAFQFPKQVTRFVRQKACQPWFKTNNADQYKTLSVVITPWGVGPGWISHMGHQEAQQGRQGLLARIFASAADGG